MESQRCKRRKDAESKSVVHIPQEIIENILTRVTCKSLVRFESVCKSWRSWLSNPDFGRRDSQSLLLISPSSRFGFFQTTTEDGITTKKFPLPWADPGSEVHVSNSCNGIVLICVGNCFYLFNPSTHYFTKVLTLDYMSDVNRGDCNYNIIIGLYYDEAVGDYKAVVLIQYRLYFGCIGSILVEASLKEKRWNHISQTNIKSDCELIGGPVVNGRLHWLKKNGVIIRFNPVLKAFENLPFLQPPIEKNLEIVGIGFLEGCLCFSRSVNGTRLEVLAMKEYGVSESWTRVLSFTGSGYSMFTYNCNPLHLTRTGDIFLSIDKENSYMSMISKIWVYNRRKKSMETDFVQDKPISIRAVSFVPHMDMLSGYYWNQAEHENLGQTENFKTMRDFWQRIACINRIR